jgi:hypothetical protein
MKYSSYKRLFRSLIGQEECPLKKRSFQKLYDFSVEKFEGLKNEVERHHSKNRKVVSQQDRFVTIVRISQRTAKMTYRPSTGELLLKIPDVSGETITKRLIKLAHDVIDNIPMDVTRVVRGNPRYNQMADCYTVRLKENTNGEDVFRYPIQEETLEKPN